MDITEIKNKDTYYKGFEEEPEIRFTILDNPEISLSIWEGYFDDIFENPNFEEGWIGFTKDYGEFLNAFSLGDPKVYLKPEEYLKDILGYKGRKLRCTEATEVLNLIIKFLEYAIEIDSLFTMEVI